MVNSATQLLLYLRIASSASSEGDGERGDFVSFLAFCCWAHIWVTAQVSRLWTIPILFSDF